METKITLRSLVCFLFMLISHYGFSQSQPYTISGTVMDESGASPGATIKVDGTNQATFSDTNGKYSLSFKANEEKVKIVVSMIGFANQVKIIDLKNKTEIIENFVLKTDAMNLDEVLITGSTVKESRRQLGNSISSIKSEAIAKSGSTNLLSSLQGKVPGAQITQNSGDPSGGMTIRLRGVKSIQGSSDPLYVIDGVIVSNNTTNVSQTAAGSQIGANATAGTNRLADINPNDIESLTVVNGAAAAAQYGSRAANGVVIITTKRGKSGTPKITFSTGFSSNELRKKVYISTYGKQFGFAALRLHTIGNVSAAVAAANNATTVGVNRNGEANTLLATN